MTSLQKGSEIYVLFHNWYEQANVLESINIYKFQSYPSKTVMGGGYKEPVMVTTNYNGTFVLDLGVVTWFTSKDSCLEYMLDNIHSKLDQLQSEMDRLSENYQKLGKELS